MSNIAISCEGLGKEYSAGTIHRGLKDILSFKKGGKDENKFWALQDFSADFYFSEACALLGLNGGGKSTLLKILARITRPTTGTALLSARVGAVIEVGSGFHPDLTAAENIYLGGKILGSSHAEIDREFDKIVEFAEIESFLDLPMKRYSSGMQSRLGFSLISCLSMPVLLIDEVLAVGDEGFRDKCVLKIKELVREGRAVIFVSHDPVLVAELCTRSIVLDAGKKIFDGSIDSGVSLYHKLNGRVSENAVV